MSDNIILITPTNGYEFDTHTQLQNEYIENIQKFGIAFSNDWLFKFKNGEELSYPEKLKFSWENNGQDEFVFELSKNEDFSDSYSFVCKESFCEIDNLEIGTKYFWRVNACKANYFFTKNNIFRFIKIDGVLNVRDVGGNKIKQGLIYRGSDLDTHYFISEQGKTVFKQQLKIKNEIELRLEVNGNRPCAIGGNVNLVPLPYRPYKEIFEERHRKGICAIMEFLSDEKNYPMYIHCLGGADRTGMIAMYLRAIAGEDDETILTDYELTSLSSYSFGLSEGVDALGFRNRNSDYFVEFLNLLDNCVKGDTFAEKLIAFLRLCGVENHTLKKIKMIIKK